MKPKVEKRKLTEIKEAFIVRVELNRGHVDSLKDLISTDVMLPPLLISDGDNELIDGRHRKVAYEELGIKEVNCVVRKFESQADKIIAALQGNVGGSLPPTHADVNHVMQILIAAGETRKSIIEKVSELVGFPKRLIQRHLDEVQSNMFKARLKRAKSSVLNGGKTVHEAAAEFGIKLKTLQKNLGDDDDRDQSTNVNQLKSHLSQACIVLSHVVGRNLSKVVRDLKDGVITSSDAEEVIGHVCKLMDRLNGHHGEWVKRFKAHIGTASTVSESSRKRARKPKEKRGGNALARMGLAD